MIDGFYNRFLLNNIAWQLWFRLSSVPDPRNSQKVSNYLRSIVTPLLFPRVTRMTAEFGVAHMGGRNGETFLIFIKVYEKENREKGGQNIEQTNLVS